MTKERPNPRKGTETGVSAGNGLQNRTKIKINVILSLYTSFILCSSCSRERSEPVPSSFVTPCFRLNPPPLRYATFIVGLSPTALMSDRRQTSEGAWR